MRNVFFLCEMTLVLTLQLQQGSQSLLLRPMAISMTKEGDGPTLSSKDQAGLLNYL